MPMSDVEQMQMVKSWVKEYGYPILFSIVVFMIASFGWRYWQKHKANKLEYANVIYSQMIEAYGQKKNEEFRLFGEKIIKDHSGSIYASLSALMLAKSYVDAEDLKSAEEKLQFVIKKSSSKEIRELALVRMARILIAKKEPQKALDLLVVEDSGFYKAMVYEVRGDAFLKLGKKDEAEKSYLKAQELNKNMKLKSPLLKIKMQQF